MSRNKDKRLHNIWGLMKGRCLNPKNIKYKRYGGRGITVCDEWMNFTGFKKWALCHGYTDELTIERVDNDGNYSPDNCIWIPPAKQALNKSTNRSIEFRGKTQTLAEWSIELDINYTTLHERLNRGQSVERAFSTPKQLTFRRFS